MPDLAPVGRAIRGITSLDERRDTIEYVSEILDEHFRHGSADVRVVVNGVTREDYDAVEGQVLRRFPTGEYKLERPCVGIEIEWIPDPPA